jgi:hypothetical protein
MRILSLFDEPRREVARLRDQAQRAKADSVVHALQDHVEHAAVKLLGLTNVYATVDEEESYSIEWIFENKRLGICVDTLPGLEDEWFIIAKDGTAESGRLADGGFDVVVERFLKLDGRAQPEPAP